MGQPRAHYRWGLWLWSRQDLNHWEDIGIWRTRDYVGQMKMRSTNGEALSKQTGQGACCLCMPQGHVYRKLETEQWQGWVSTECLTPLWNLQTSVPLFSPVTLFIYIPSHSMIFEHLCCGYQRSGIGTELCKYLIFSISVLLLPLTSHLSLPDLCHLHLRVYLAGWGQFSGSV